MLFDLIIAAVLEWPLATAFWALGALALVLFICWMWARAFRAELEFADQAAELAYREKQNALEASRRNRAPQQLLGRGGR